ncbi:motility associated factor glycosyltransferase family protein [Hydrogenimonas urashimensis]|uniref:motility associated factor glycosyltransferase family protein n=1 Tax=Hydrogenimonas urashimensis TaxID=2740515 RepID=UPI0019154F8C|nr:6-hydroxymethylpterin diphosphokinase MptE-like protein [Hydrogenimonas urashimensis]
MQSVEQEAMTRFMKNLSFFQARHPDLYQKLAAFDNAVEHGHYVTRYELEYKEEGYFDVFEKESGNWLYGMDSNKHADVIADSIDYSKEGNLFETFREIPLDEEKVKFYESLPLTDTALSTIAPVVYYANQIAGKDTTMKKIYKFIFFGTGLGLHLRKIHEKIDATVYLIVEDDLELFRLSLFVTDYEALTSHNAVLFFSIFDDDETFRYKSYAFLREMFPYNHYIKYFLLLSHDTEKVKIFHSAVISQDYLKFPHSAVMEVYLRPYRYLAEDYRFIDIGRVSECALFENKPVLILGAGPSLERNIDWVRTNQERFVIVSVTAVMALLERHNVKPDILVHVDGFEASMKHLEKVQSMNFFSDTILLFASFAYPPFTKAFKKENIYIFQAAAKVKEEFSQLTASNVGIMTYALGLMFGTHEMYTLGLDLALDSESGATHTTDHVHAKKLDIDHAMELEESVKYHESVVWTKGNFEEEVPSVPAFVSALMELRGIAAQLQKSGQKIYNLSCGAYIQGSEPMPIENVHVDSLGKMDKSELKNEIVKCFDANSSIRLTENEIEMIKKRIEHGKNILALLEAFKLKKFSSIDIYHYELLGLMIDILAEESKEEAVDTNGVISVYIQMVGSYVFDFINTREVDNPKKHVKKLNRLFMTQFIRLVEYYVDFLENFLKNYLRH